MTDEDFDATLIAAGFDVIARDGWPRFSVAAAAQSAALDLARARMRIPSRSAFLLRFGAQADRAALAEDAPAATVQERLFDMVMRRIDVLQTHRAGVLALFRGLPADPTTALLLTAANIESMRWMLDACGAGGQGLLGGLRAKGLLVVWLVTLRAWQADESADLGATMAALDAALARAAQVARSLPFGMDRPSASPDVPLPPQDTEPSFS